MSRRTARHKALNPLYSLWPQATDACTYCGVIADSVDHVPPLSMLHALGYEHFETRGVKFRLVPACRECNSLLADCASYNIAERKARVKKALQRKYMKHIKQPKWTPSELDELGYNLRVIIEAGNDVSEWIKRRLHW